jgi:hypothetical protein
MELQEMGVNGQGSTEPGVSNDDKIFFMKYPYPFLQYWYGRFTLAQQEATPTDTSIVSSSSVDVVPDMSGKSITGDGRFPHLPPSKTVVLKHWTLVSDDLITVGRNSGQYKATFKCNIVDGDVKVCGADRNIRHYRGKAVSTTNFIRHVTSTVATKEEEILRTISWCECS